jgi:hypothetical protein
MSVTMLAFVVPSLDPSEPRAPVSRASVVNPCHGKLRVLRKSFATIMAAAPSAEAAARRSRPAHFNRRSVTEGGIEVARI